MSEFKTQAEIIKWLADGGAIRIEGEEPIFLKEDGSFNTDKTMIFNSPHTWLKAEKPKPKIKLRPFLFDIKNAVEIGYFKSEYLAKFYCDRYEYKYLGPAKGIPDQEIEE